MPGSSRVTKHLAIAPPAPPAPPGSPGAPVTAPPGMRARAGQEEALDAAEALRARALLEQLARQHLAVEDVAAGDAEARLELARAERQPLDDPVGQLRADLGEAGDRGVGGGLGVDVRREALAEQRQHVAARRRERVVGGRLAGGLDPRARGGPAGAGVVGRRGRGRRA